VNVLEGIVASTRQELAARRARRAPGELERAAHALVA